MPCGITGGCLGPEPPAALRAPRLPSYTHRPPRRGPQADAASTVGFWIPKNRFAWEILKIDSRPYNGPRPSHMGSGSALGASESYVAVVAVVAVLPCVPCSPHAAYPVTRTL